MYYYQQKDKERDTRTMMAVCCLINAFGNLISLLLSINITFGIPPTAFAYLGVPITDPLRSAVRSLTLYALVAKLIPTGIEASLFSIYVGIDSFCTFFLEQVLGNMINDFVGVSEEDLSKLWILFLIAVICSLAPLAILWLIPRR